MAAHLEETGSQQAFTGTRTSDTPTLSAASQTAGRLTVLVYFGDSANGLTVPAGEGWTKVQAARSGSPFFEVVAVLKVWGLGGQTDDATPTFTFSSTAGLAWAYSLVFSNPANATSPWTQVSDALVASATDVAIAATATPAAPSATDTGSQRTIVRAWMTGDDNTLNANTEGTLLLGGASGNVSTSRAGAITCLEGTTTSGSTGTATVTESTNGNDVATALTLVLTAPVFVATLGPPPQSRTRRLLPILVR